MAGEKREPYRILITDAEDNFLYVDVDATTAELELLFAAINQRSTATAELVPQLADAGTG